MRVIDELAQLLVRIFNVSPPSSSAPALGGISRLDTVRLAVCVRVGIRIRISIGVGVSISIGVRIEFALGIRVAVSVSAKVHGRPGSRGLPTIGIGRGVFHIDILVALRLDRVVNHNLVRISWRHGRSFVTVEIGQRVSV